MEQKTDRIHPLTPLERNDLEQRLEKKRKDVKSFNDSIIIIKELILYFKRKNHKSKKKYRKHKTLTTLLKTFDTFVNIATTSSSFTLSLTGISLIAIPISNCLASGLTISNRIVFEMSMQRYSKYRKQCDKDHKTIKSFDKFYRNSLQDNVIDESE